MIPSVDCWAHFVFSWSSQSALPIGVRAYAREQDTHANAHQSVSMYREVSDLSFGSDSEEEHATEPAREQTAAAQAREDNQNTSWKTYTNRLDEEPDGTEPDSGEVVEDSASSTERPHSTRATVRFNTVYEASQDDDQQSQDHSSETRWADCDPADLVLFSSHLASAALPPTKQNADDRRAADLLLLQNPLEADDMLGFGTLDLRSCTLRRRAAAFTATQRLGVHASFSSCGQVPSHLCQHLHNRARRCRQDCH